MGQYCDHTLEYGFKQYLGTSNYVDTDFEYGNWGELYTFVVFLTNRWHCCAHTQFVVRMYDEVTAYVSWDKRNPYRYEEVARFVIQAHMPHALKRTPELPVHEAKAFKGLYGAFNANVADKFGA